MLNKIIEFALHNRLFILLTAVLLTFGGIYVTETMEVDVFPDLNAPTVVIMTEAQGMAPEEVEKTVTFPIETGEGVRAQAYAIEASAGPSTSDRAEVRCVLGLRARRHGTTALNGVTDVQMLPAAQQEHGFVLVWPAAGESRWTTARRLRVAPDSLRPAGKGALLAFRG